MLKIFDSAEKFESKVNFVDDNNVVVGYDMDQQCCERATWYLTQNPKSREDITVPDEILSKLTFDPDYFEDGNDGETASVIFKLVGDTDPWYLILSNTHNGYYSHGFTMDVGGVRKHSGSL